MPPPAARPRAAGARAPLLLMFLLLIIICTTLTTTASAQRLSALRTPSDIAALRARRDGAEAAAAAALGTNNKPKSLVLDAPELDCVPENATATTITLELCTGESGAPLGVLVEWMDVVAFARNDGWYRGDDERLCRLRLTAPVPRDTCVPVVVGGEAMLAQLDPKPRPYPGGGGEWDKKHDGEKAHPPPLLPPDAVLGDEACLGDLRPEMFYYVFRARARGSRDQGAGGEEDEGRHKGGKDEKNGVGEEGGGQGEDERHHAARPAVEPSLWSRNEVCATLDDEDEGDVVPPVVADVGVGP